MSNENEVITKELNNVLEFIGDAWILSIIYALSTRPQRFCELQRSLNGLNPVTLTDRLKKLEIKGIIMREEETVDKISVVYELTKTGKKLLPLMKEISKLSQVLNS